MKKNLLITCSIILLAFFWSCEKEIKDPNNSEETASEAKISDSKQQPSCRLTKIDYGGGYYEKFHYNKRGLADEWLIVNGSFYYKYTMQYDANDKLSKGKALFSDGSKATFNCKYENGKISKITFYDGVSNAVINEIVITYDKHGDILKEQDLVANIYTEFKNTPLGPSRIDFYINDTLYYTERYTYYQPNRDPYLAVKGVPYGFFTYDLVFSKWWETSFKFTIYDSNGDPIVLEDEDPYKTIMHKNSEHYLTSVTYYDRVSKSWLPIIFDYQNCCENNADKVTQPASEISGNFGTAKRNSRIFLFAPMQKIKQQIIEMRQQYNK